MAPLAGNNQILHGHVPPITAGLVDRSPTIGDILLDGMGVAGVGQVHVTAKAYRRGGVGVQQRDHRIDLARTF